MTRLSLHRFALLLAVAVVPVLVLGVFVGALASADSGSATVPAAVVNNDRLVQGKGADGTPTTVAAGRLVVTELTKPAPAGGGARITWRLSNTAQAADQLRSGQVYAVVTIPAGFSKAIASVSGTDPTWAGIRIETDDAHGYVVSQLASALGTSVTASLGSTIAGKVVSGLYGGLGTLKTSLGAAAAGARKLGSGAGALAGGLGTLATAEDGIATGASALQSGASGLSGGAESLASGLTRAASGASRAASGAGGLSSGVTSYTKGVSSLAAGLNTAASGSSGLQGLPSGVRSYTAGVVSAKDALAAVLAADPTISPTTRAALERVQSGLTDLSAANDGLVAGADGAAALRRGVAASASGAGKLAAGGAALRTGATGLADGLRPLAAGLRSSAAGASSLGSGAARLSSGAGDLSSGAGRIADGIRSSGAGARTIGSGAAGLGDGLTTAAQRLPGTDAAQAERIAGIVADPVRATAVRQHETQSIGLIVAALILPVALWIGASAAVLLLGAVRRRLLATGIGSGRLVGAALVRGGLLALLQAVLLTVLVAAVFTPAWQVVLLVLLVAVVAGASFFAVHQLLGALFGRAGTVLSLVLLGVQLVAVGGLYPIELVSRPFQVISPYLPMTAAVSALQQVLTGADGPALAGGLAVLALYAAVAYGLTVAVVARRRASVALFGAPIGAGFG
ncbi:MAG: putative rane protein [Microbacteriaceae bacterium]|nr:putative rane protein [Microbacteriaceae bacterium]